MNRGKRYDELDIDRKKAFYIIGIVVLLALIVLIFTLSIYKAKKEANSQIAQMENITSSDATIVSTTEDKSINEVKNETEQTKIAINVSNQTESKPTSMPDFEEVEPEPEPEVIEEPKVVELHFRVPVEGEIAKDFSDSSLVYSETLEEWTVHLGIDIKAEKGSVVVASENGKVESIKNDPRYGTTITIVHENGFKTIYSNLLSADFVTEGEEVEKGQTIASVGDSAAFEIADESHLHFEMKKDGETVNPSNYWEKE